MDIFGKKIIQKVYGILQTKHDTEEYSLDFAKKWTEYFSKINHKSSITSNKLNFYGTHKAILWHRQG